MPDNLHVGGNLNLYGCKNLKSLPDNLHVGGDLSLVGTPIQSLPDNLKVVGVISIGGTPLNNDIDLILKYQVKGYRFYV